MSTLLARIAVASAAVVPAAAAAAVAAGCNPTGGGSDQLGDVATDAAHHPRSVRARTGSVSSKNTMVVTMRGRWMRNRRKRHHSSWPV
uniref:Putative secreted protein n=1 Tax=Anopheles marajoara TaxID=58244 RepID=A0A2M4CAA3_9DIPT